MPKPPIKRPRGRPKKSRLDSPSSGQAPASRPDAALIPAGYLTLDQAGERLRRDAKTIRRMIEFGRLRGFRVGYEIVVSEESIAAWLRPKLIKARAGNLTKLPAAHVDQLAAMAPSAPGAPTNAA